MTAGHLFVDSAPPAGGERFETLLQHRHLVVERIVSSAAVVPTEYVQPQDEWVLLVQGTATLEVAGESRPMRAGDYLFLPARTPHTVREVSEGALWLAVHLHPSERTTDGGADGNDVRKSERLPGNRSMPDATVIPVLHYPDVPAAVAWLQRVFGMQERLRIGTHRVQMAIGQGHGQGAIVVAQGPADPAALRGASTMVRVPDVDAHHERAAREGAAILGAPQSHPYGERQYSVQDPGGHVWTFSQSEADVDPASWGGRLIHDTPGAA